jgi:hypothetical protein
MAMFAPLAKKSSNVRSWENLPSPAIARTGDS